ncbi:hypothetical protein [Micromonospora echinofusca]|uniref:DUF4328 domain-containing protein n=1 Tax=Micromonospora echinofusca TaxID=47858 RepID=A0ABS3VP01_MICEH|nr:hypothetical protein [Micromonospora echinofusca]MBO4206227.1 hypothetical protein [Micromonospora echinofusca]
MSLATILLTLPVVALLAQPLWAPSWGAGILGEVTAFGVPGAVAALALFFGLVALYCRKLQHLQERVRPDARARSPRSVWLMFAIPFNFVEDFRIIADLGGSLRRDGRLSGSVIRSWKVVGTAWCILQIASLLPGTVGLTSGLLAVAAWAWHWGHTALLGRRLTAPTTA